MNIIAGYFVNINIFYLHSLRNTNNETLDELFTEIDEKFKWAGASNINPGTSSDNIIYAFPSTRQRVLIKLLELTFSIQKQLKENKEIFEFNIIVFRSCEALYSIVQSLDKIVYLAPIDNSIIYYGEHSLDIFSLLLLKDCANSYLKINGWKNKQIVNYRSNIEEFIIDEGILQKLSQTLESQEAGSVTYITGFNNLGHSIMAARALEDWVSSGNRGIMLTSNFWLLESSTILKPLFDLIFADEVLYPELIELPRAKEFYQNLQKGEILSNTQLRYDAIVLLDHYFSINEQFLLIIDKLENWSSETTRIICEIFIELRHKPSLVFVANGLYFPIRGDNIINIPSLLEAAKLEEQKENLDLENAASLPLISKYHLSLLAVRENWSEDISYMQFIQIALEDFELHIIRAIAYAPSMFNRATLMAFFNEAQTGIILDFLIDNAFIIDSCGSYYSNYTIAAIGEDKSLATRVYKFFYKAHYFKRYDIASFYFIISLNKIEENKIYISNIVQKFLHKNLMANIHELERFATLKNIKLPLDVHLWILLNNKDYSAINEYISSNDIGVSLPLAISYYLQGQIEASMNACKKSLFKLQESGGSREERTTSLLLQGLNMLALAKHKEAQNYFTMTRNSKVSDTLIQAGTLFETISLFINGKLTSCLDSLKQIRNYRPLATQIFLEGRVHFELGDFEEAHHFFEQGMNFGKKYNRADVLNTCTLWLGRTYFYRFKFKEGVQSIEYMQSSNEKFYFVAEGLYINNDHKRALAIIERIVPMVVNEFRQGQASQSRWSNGYSRIEGMVYKGKSGKKKNIFYTQVMSLAALLYIENNNPAKALELLKIICSRPVKGELEPYLHIYYYIYYMCLDIYGTESDISDKNLYLSYAVSLMQNYASQIHSGPMRNNFLHNNFWNRKILQVGQHNSMSR